MAGAALDHSVCATTPADTPRLARRPSTMGAPAARSPGGTLGETASSVIATVPRRWSELRAAIDPQRVAGDPAGRVRGKKGDRITDVVRLGDALQGLQAQGEIATRVRPGEARHVGFDDARRDGVNADPALTQCRGKVLD